MIDAARGVAVLAMAIYHLSWDLRYFGYIAADVEAALAWRIFARSIAGTFLFIVGVSLALAARRGIDWRRYVRRLSAIAAAATAITAVTWYLFRDTYIFFGILHHIAVASVLGLAFVRVPPAAVMGAAAFSFLAPHFLAGPAFDHPALLWLGLATEFPRTNDFVPLFPWFGVVLLGMATARLAPLLPKALSALAGGMRVPTPILWMGRHSLVIYLVHQPILFGLVALTAELAPPDLLSFEPAYLQSCSVSCVEAEAEPDLCTRICACLARRSQAEGLWDRLMRQALSGDEETRYFALVDECREAAEAP